MARTKRDVLLLILIGVFWVIYAPGFLDSIDNILQFEQASNFFHKGEWRVEDDRPVYMTLIHPEKNWRVSIYPPGHSFMMLGMIALTHPLAREFGPYHRKLEEFTCSFLNTLWGMLLLFFLYHQWKKEGLLHVPQWCILLGLNTFLFPYIRTSFNSIPFAVLIVILFFYSMNLDTLVGRDWIYIGIYSFIAIMFRYESFYILGCLLLVSLFLYRQNRDVLVRLVITSVVTFILAFVVLLLYSFTFMGYPFWASYAHVLDITLSNVGKVLAGYVLYPGRSIFVFSPLLILAFLALTYKGMYRARFLVAGIWVANVISISMNEAWIGGWSWGPRFFIASLFVTLVLLPYITRTRYWKKKSIVTFFLILSMGQILLNLSVVVGNHVCAGLNFESRGISYPQQMKSFLMSPPFANYEYAYLLFFRDGEGIAPEILMQESCSTYPDWWAVVLYKAYGKSSLFFAHIFMISLVLFYVYSIMKASIIVLHPAFSNNERFEKTVRV